MKNLFLKKAAIVAIAVVTMSVAANAQEKGDMAVGGNFVVGMGDEITNFGIGAKFQYNVTNPIRLEAQFTYFLPKDYGDGFGDAKLKMWDLSAYVHYLFPVADQINVYPLAGLGILGVTASAEADTGFGTYSASASTSNFGFGLGGGIDYKLSEKLILNAEVKYRLGGDWNRLFLSAGIAYKF